MPRQNFDFRTVADTTGKVVSRKEVALPVKVSVGPIAISTTGGCLNRRHSTTIRLDGQIWFGPSVIIDCELHEIGQSVSRDPGRAVIEIESLGFNPGEEVEGQGWVDYQIELFAAHSPIPFDEASGHVSFGPVTTV